MYITKIQFIEIYLEPKGTGKKLYKSNEDKRRRKIIAKLKGFKPKIPFQNLFSKGRCYKSCCV